MGEGIKVHGHWIIDVRHPDGTLVATHEFENELATTGPGLLVRALTRQLSVGPWGISVTPALNSGTGFFMIEPNAIPTFQDPRFFRTLTIQSSGFPPTLTLAGTMTAPTDITIGAVYTLIGECVPTTTPQTCSGSPLVNRFTQRTLPVPITVAAEQIVQVKVTLSFS